MTNLTQRELFNALIVNLKGETPLDKDGNPIKYDVLIAGLEDRIEKLDKKNSNSGTRKPTKNQVENKKIIGNIEDYLATVDRATCTEIANALNLSTQKIASLCKQSDNITRTVEKSQAYYSLVAE